MPNSYHLSRLELMDEALRQVNEEWDELERKRRNLSWWQIRKRWKLVHQQVNISIIRPCLRAEKREILDTLRNSAR